MGCLVRRCTVGIYAGVCVCALPPDINPNLFAQFGFTCVYVVYLTQGTATLLSKVADGWYTEWRFMLVFWVPVLFVLANIQT